MAPVIGAERDDFLWQFLARTKRAIIRFFMYETRQIGLRVIGGCYLC